VVVRTLRVETLVIADDTKVATVGNEVVKTAFVTVLTGKEPVRAVAVKTEMTLPEGTAADPLFVETRGFSPGTILMGPDCANRALGLFTPVH
jgi:hypothetical protein